MQSPAEVTFSQIRSRLLVDALVLRHDRVIIRKGLPDSPDERHIRLDDIAPDIEFAERRFTAVFYVMLGLSAIFGGAIWKVAGPKPEALASVLIVLFGSLAFNSIIFAFISCAKVPVATVKNRSGDVLVQLKRERDVAADYEVFVLQLQRRLNFRNRES